MCRERDGLTRALSLVLCRAVIIPSGYFWLLIRLHVRKDDCVTSLIPWRMLSRFMSEHTAKGEGCSPCFAELPYSVRDGFQEIPSDLNCHLLPCYLSSLRTLWKVLSICQDQPTENLYPVWHWVAFLVFQHYFLTLWVNSHVALESPLTFSSLCNKKVVLFWNVQFIK